MVYAVYVCMIYAYYLRVVRHNTCMVLVWMFCMCMTFIHVDGVDGHHYFLFSPSLHSMICVHMRSFL